MTKKITVQEEGITISESVRVLNFIGAGATATGNGSVAAITISGGGGGGTPPPTDIYVSPNSGSDTNDGLTPGTALLTITKAINMVGEASPVNFAPIIHLESATYSASQLQGVTWPALTQESSGIIFWGDGAGQPADDGCNVVHSGSFAVVLADDARFGDRTELTGAQPVPADLLGYTLEITSGTNAGQRRTILEQNNDAIVVAQGFKNAQASGNFRIFSPGFVIDNDSAADGDLRQHFQMMPLTCSYGSVTDWARSGDGGEPLPNAPSCVWANLLLTSSSGNYTEFVLAGGQACLFGVILEDNALLRTELVSLWAGTTKSLLPQNNAVVFEPPPTLYPLQAAISNISSKWNGWGVASRAGSNGVACSKIGRLHCGAWYDASTLELQGLELGRFVGVYTAGSFRCHFSKFHMDYSVIAGIVDVRGGTCFFDYNVTAQQLEAQTYANVEFYGSIVYNGNQAVTAQTGARVSVDMTRVPPGSTVQVTGAAPITAIPVGDQVGIGVAVLTIDTDQLSTYFTGPNMGIMGPDGSIIVSNSGS